MSIMLRVLLIAMSVISSFYVIWRIRNSKMQIEYALFWIIMAVLMIIMSVFPQIVYWITGKMGMMSPANVVYLFIIAILLIKTFMMTIELSSLENKFKDLTQQIAINEKQAADEKKALAALDRVMEKWTAKYPNSMKRWKDNWDAISPIFKFSAAVRKVIYTTNAIESLNSTYRKLNRQRSVFPSDTALLKALYLATFEATKKWTATIRNWAQVYGELSIMYEGRLPE